MKPYKYETHLHTSESSKCGVSSAAEMVLYFKKLGYTGIFVTDHLLSQETPAEKDRPWSERIDDFYRGYEVAAQEGQRVELDVFLGWEYGYGWTHFLTYGLDKDWLLAHPDLLDWEFLDYFDRVREAGGFVVHAHPFREKVELIRLVPNHVDAVEIFNAGRPDDANRHALDYANSYGLLKTAGSDIHATTQERLYGMRFSRRLTDINDFIMAVKSGEGVISCDDF